LSCEKIWKNDRKWWRRCLIWFGLVCLGSIVHARLFTFSTERSDDSRYIALSRGIIGLALNDSVDCHGIFHHLIHSSYRHKHNHRGKTRERHIQKMFVFVKLWMRRWESR
jgi:hypothetical protein